MEPGDFLCTRSKFSSTLSEVGHITYFHMNAAPGSDLVERLNALGQCRRELSATDAASAQPEDWWQAALGGCGLLVWKWNVPAGLVWLSACEFAPALDAVQSASLPIAKWRQNVHPEDRDQLFSEQARCFTGGSGSYAVQYRLALPEGAWTWVKESGRVLQSDAEGRPLMVAGSVADLSAQKQLEQTVRAGESRMASVQSIARFGSWEKDLALAAENGDSLLGWSDEMFHIAGLPVDSGPMTLSRFLQMVPEPERQELQDSMAEAVRERREYTFEHHLTRPDGSRRLIQERAQLFYDAEGQPLKMVGMAYDITDRRAAEQRADFFNRLSAVSSSVSEAILRVHTVPDLYQIVCDAMVDRGGLRMAWIGVKDEETQDLRPLVSQGDSEGYLGCISVSVLPDERGLGPSGRAFRDGVVSCCNDIVSDSAFAPWREPALQRGYRSCAALPLKRGKAGCQGVLVVYSDVVDIFDAEALLVLESVAGNISLALEAQVREQQRVEAEASLRESQERFSEMADNIGEIFYNYDVINGRLLYANRTYERIWGLTMEHIYANPTAYLDSVHPDDRPRAEAAFYDQLAGKETNVEFRVVRPDSSECWVHEHGVPVLDAHGEVERIVGTMRDITERKLLEQQFFRTQRMESLGTLAGGIAHDLNNVLAPIIMSIELLKMQEENPMRRSILDTIEASAQRGAGMVKQVLSFARGVEGRQVDMQVSHLVTEIEKIANETFPKNLQIRNRVDANLWVVRGDPTQLHQVLLNLAVNARDAMPLGGTLVFSAQNIVLDAAYAAMNLEARPGPHVLIEVEDSGTGMTADVLDRIFEPFYTTKEMGKGTGLGLSTTLAIIKSHGGFIRVRSELGKGSRFSIYLPAQQDRYVLEESDPAHKLPRGHGECVLVVDDEEPVRHIAKETLEAFGYKVLTAGDGAEAIAIYANHLKEIAVVLTDMMMPVMDGPAIIRIMNRMNPRVKIIAASGLNATNVVTKATNVGVRHFIPKPYTAETLLTTLHEVLSISTNPATRGGM